MPRAVGAKASATGGKAKQHLEEFKTATFLLIVVLDTGWKSTLPTLEQLHHAKSHKICGFVDPKI